MELGCCCCFFFFLLNVWDEMMCRRRGGAGIYEKVGGKRWLHVWETWSVRIAWSEPPCFIKSNVLPRCHIRELPMSYKCWTCTQNDDLGCDEHNSKLYLATCTARLTWATLCHSQASITCMSAYSRRNGWMTGEPARMAHVGAIVFV
jgi:hypothetical protein